jgi:hypothetical protein
MTGRKLNEEAPDYGVGAVEGIRSTEGLGRLGRDATWQDLEGLHSGLRKLGWIVALERWSDGGFINASRYGASVGLVTWSETQGTITISPSNNRSPDRNFPILHSDMAEQIGAVWPEGVLYSKAGNVTVYINCTYHSPDFLIIE